MFIYKFWLVIFLRFYKRSLLEELWHVYYIDLDLVGDHSEKDLC